MEEWSKNQAPLYRLPSFRTEAPHSLAGFLWLAVSCGEGEEAQNTVAGAHNSTFIHLSFIMCPVNASIVLLVEDL